MSKEILITGVKVVDQMRKAQVILETEVIPREEEFQRRKKNGTLKERHTFYDTPHLL